MNVFLIAALSADGLIGRSADHLADWTSTADKKLFVQLTREAGVIVMGSHTFATIGRALPGRRMIVYTSNPSAITADGVETTQEPPTQLVARLTQEGVRGVAICGGASIYTQFMQAGVVNNLHLTIQPVLLGKGIALFNDSLDTRLQLKASQMLDEQVVYLHYTVQPHD